MTNNTDQIKNSFSFNFTPDLNGGESFVFYISKDEGQTLSLQSYTIAAEFFLGFNTFTPENLRKLADLLEKFKNEIES